MKKEPYILVTVDEFRDYYDVSSEEISDDPLVALHGAVDVAELHLVVVRDRMLLVDQNDPPVGCIEKRRFFG